MKIPELKSFSDDVWYRNGAGRKGGMGFRMEKHILSSHTTRYQFRLL